MNNSIVAPANAGDAKSTAAKNAGISVLSVGSIEPALVAAGEAFHTQGGALVRITFANTPAIRRRMEAGLTADVVIAPPEAVDDFTRAGKVIGESRVHVCRVGVGVMVRADAPVPDISSGEAVRRALLDAESVVFNRSSSGLAAEAVLRKMGIFEQISGRVQRYDSGAAMMERMISGKGKEIGFGAIVEILAFGSQGVKLVGPLPPDIQRYTPYVGVPMAEAANPSGAQAFIRYLATPAAKALFAAHGMN